MRRHAQWLLLCFVIAILAGCGSEITTSQSKVMVEVGNSSITEAEFTTFLDQNSNNINNNAGGLDANTTRQQLLEQLILQKVLLEESAKLGAGIDSVTAEQTTMMIDQALEQENAAIADKEKPTFADYEAFAKKNRFGSVEGMRAYVAQILTFESYAKMLQLPSETPQFHLFHILVSTQTVSESVALDRVNQLLTQLKAGEDFSALAQQYSEDTGSGANGGDLGWYTKEQFAGFVPEFATALNTLEIGQLSEPVKTEFGYHIMKITESRNATSFGSFQELMSSPEGMAYVQGKVEEYRQKDLIKNYVRAEDVPFPESVTVFQ
ncbi:peptidylprolyl isomerase [Herpetosiphon llansteffanensis]|uniref:peptidylprolyl isomerase n=1 Tax=Herpetosiphon llansteffanensis TaxID=2094568 RepID=UPI000D7C1FA7|nr:peptidylprolyl isomerase [Herpetosiphon llansteffanensis]